MPVGGAELSEKLPDEVFQLVDSFKKFVREQKAHRDQKFEVSAILEVGRDIEEFISYFHRVSVDSDKNSQLVQQIKDDTTKLLRHSELAYSLLRSHFSNSLSPSQQAHQHATQQPPLSQFNSQPTINNPVTTAQSSLFNPSLNSNLNSVKQGLDHPSSAFFSQSTLGHQSSLLHQQQPFYLSGGQTYGVSHTSQFTNTSSSQYFAELADQFEARMKAYGEQIKELKMSLDSITRTYNVDELFKWLKKQRETLGEIAAKIYMTHERIMERKAELDRMNQDAQKELRTTNFNIMSSTANS